MARTIFEIIRRTFPGLRFERRAVVAGRTDWYGYRTYILGNVRVFFYLDTVYDATILHMETRYRCFREIDHRSVVEVARVNSIPEHILENVVRTSVEKSVIDLMRLMYEKPLDETRDEN
jgi:hypothetical protein